MPTQLTNDILVAAIEGFEAQKKRIDDKISEIRSMLGGGPTEPTATKPQASVGKRRKVSAAARRRMKEGQQRRWAKIKGESEPPTTPVAPPKAKRKLSKAGRAAIVASLKKRWALKRAEEAAKTKPAGKALVKKAKKTAKKVAPVNKAASVKKSSPATAVA